MKQQLLAKVGRRLTRPIRLYALWQSHNHYLQLVAGCAQATLKQALGDAERDWVERIEGLRAELVTSTEKVQRTDYGAGLREAATSDAAPSPASVGGVELEDEVGRIAKASSKSKFWGVLLFELIRSLRPTSCLELGTALGISGAYQAAALALNGRGQLTSLEGSASLAAIAQRNWRRLGLGNASVVVGRFSETLHAAAAATAPIDFAFIDGHHDEHATIEYFERLLPHLASPACVVFDDITWSEGMRRAWRAISKDTRSKVCVDFGPVGIVFVGGFSKVRPSRVPLA